MWAKGGKGYWYARGDGPAARILIEAGGILAAGAGCLAIILGI